MTLRLTNLALAAALLVVPSFGVQSQPVPDDPPIQRPQPIPQTTAPRVLPAPPQYGSRPPPTNLPPPPVVYVAPAMIPQGLLPPGVQPGSTMPIPMPSPSPYGR